MYRNRDIYGIGVPFLVACWKRVHGTAQIPSLIPITVFLELHDFRIQMTLGIWLVFLPMTLPAQ